MFFSLAQSKNHSGFNRVCRLITKTKKKKKQRESCSPTKYSHINLWGLKAYYITKILAVLKLKLKNSRAKIYTLQAVSFSEILLQK